MKLSRVIGKLWKWSPLVTLPVAALFVFWALEVRDAYVHLGLRYETLNNHVNLKRLGEMQANYLLRKTKLRLEPRVPRPSGGLRQIDLFVNEASEDTLNASLPHSGRQYVPASLIYPDGDMWEVSLKYRGDFFWHWAGIKKSLRVKTKKKHLFDRMRAFNLIAPKTDSKLQGSLAFDLGARMGLIVPEHELANVSINGENRGVYVLVEQPEEMILRKNARMPGDIFAGEFAARDQYRGITPRLFQQPGLWEKIAINNHFPDENDDSMQRMCALLGEEPSAQRSAALREILNYEQFGRFAAYRALTQSDHFDETHNWRLYYDPWRNKFEPLVWDPDGWHPGWIPKAGERARPDIVSSILDAILIEEGPFIVARQRAMEEYFQSGAHEGLLEDLEELIAAAEVPLERDPSLMKHLDLQSPEEVFRNQRKLRNSIDRITDDLYESYMTPAALSYAELADKPNSIRLEVSGRRPFYSFAVDFSRPLAGSVQAKLGWFQPDGYHEVDVSGALTQHGSRLTIERPLLSQSKVTHHPERVPRLRRAVKVLPATYDLTLLGDGVADVRIAGVVGFHGSDLWVNAQRVSELENRVMQRMQDAVQALPSVAPEVWSGSIRLEGVRTVKSDVIIEPGTTIQLGPDATVILEGRLMANGTEERPIRFVPAGESPWGVFALRGPGARGSELTYCTFTGGSGYKVPLAEYSAMFSIHDVPGVVVRHCLFQDSKVVDDMVHAVYSKVQFSDCVFERSLFDAVDLDISEAVVERCRFTESGNDALDLMTSTVVVKDTILERSLDKGISVGEDTSVLAINCLVDSCAIGFQAKDRSTAVIYNCELRGNPIAVDAYKKNWRYDSGGFAYIYKSSLIENVVNLAADKHSRIRVHDTYLPVGVESSRRIRIEATCDGLEPSKPRDEFDIRFPEEQKVKVGLFKSHWSHADPRRRGVRFLN